MEIRRDRYLKRLQVRMHNGMIKVITGARRCGKSYLVFKLFRNWLIDQGIPQDHIVEMAFDMRENAAFRSPDYFLSWAKEQMQGEGFYYLLLDEVQMLDSFEEVLNSLLHIDNIDVYVTGSNSKFLSSDVITEFRGRGDEVRIQPLSFSEFMQTYSGNRYDAWAEYLMYGGMPLAATMQTDEQKASYLQALFTETYLKDILDHNRIKNNVELDELVDVLASSVGSLTNPTKIAATFRSVHGSTLSPSTVQAYIGYLEDPFLIEEAVRFDVKGRHYIGSPKKYYFEDVGLRNARLGFRQVEETHLMENIIFNELRSRGMLVDVGVVPVRERNDAGILERKQLEIDFVATRGSSKYYIQSAYALPNEEKRHQEEASLVRVPDSFRKIILVGTPTKTWHDEQGITFMNVLDFLLDEKSLER